MIFSILLLLVILIDESSIFRSLLEKLNKNRTSTLWFSYEEKFIVYSVCFNRRILACKIYGNGGSY